MDDGASPKLHYAERNNWFSDFLKKLNRRNPDKITEQEIISIVNEGHETGVLQDSEVEMIQNIFEFTDKEAKDIMTHRKHICALDGTKTLAQVFEEINREYFYFADRGCIVNLANVAGMDDRSILFVDDQRIAISKTNLSDFKTTMLRFWRKQI